MFKKTRKTLLGLFILIICLGMLTGTTYAWLSDLFSSGSNVIQAGNLDISVEYTLDGENWNNLDGAKDLFKKDAWEPGSVVGSSMDYGYLGFIPYDGEDAIIENIRATGIGFVEVGHYGTSDKGTLYY